MPGDAKVKPGLLTWTDWMDQGFSLPGMRKALQAAGIDPDPATWAPADVDRAALVLDRYMEERSSR